jgi:hypothetical protein
MQKGLILFVLLAESMLAQMFPAGSGSAAPANAIAWFRVSCPSGWSEYTAARGRYVVGVPAGGTVEAAVGTALTDQENRNMPLHSHENPTFTHTHSVTIQDHGHNLPRMAPNSNYQVAAGSGAQVQNPNSTGSTIDTLPTPTTQTTGSASPSLIVNDYGYVSGTTAPYVQLYLCKKN